MRCCCWKDLRLGVLAAIMFTFTTSFTQIFAEAAFWWTGSTFTDHLLSGLCASCGSSTTGTTTGYYVSPTSPIVTFGLFVAMTTVDGLMIVVSLLGLLGVNDMKRGCAMVTFWVIILIAYTGYEVAFNVILYYKLEMNYHLITRATPVILMILYWGLKFFINFGNIIVGIGYIAQMKSESNRTKMLTSSNHNLNLSYPAIYPMYTQVQPTTALDSSAPPLQSRSNSYAGGVTGPASTSAPPFYTAVSDVNRHQAQNLQAGGGGVVYSHYGREQPKYSEQTAYAQFNNY